MAGSTPRKGALASKLLKNYQGKAVANQNNIVVSIPDGQGMSLADIEAKVRRSNSNVSTKNIVVQTEGKMATGTTCGTTCGCTNDSKMAEILKQLSKLDLLEKLHSDVGELRKSIEFCHDTVGEVKKENEGLRNCVRTLVQEVTALKESRKSEGERVLEMEWRSMRDNLLFHGIKEEEEEDAEVVVQNFIKDELQVNKEGIQFARVHRMGLKKIGKTRPIVAKFEHFKERETVRFSAKNLAGKKYGISEQLPKEWAEKRKSLMPKLREAKALGQRAKFVKDKLVVSGQIVVENPVPVVPNNQPGMEVEIV